MRYALFSPVAAEEDPSERPTSRHGIELAAATVKAGLLKVLAGAQQSLTPK